MKLTKTIEKRYLTSFKNFISPKETAVLVVDVQNDYCSKQGKISKFRKFDMSPLYEMTKN